MNKHSTPVFDRKSQAPSLMQNPRFRKTCLHLLLSAAFVISSAPARAQSVWQGTNSANWDDIANWSTGVVPNAAGVEARFTNAASVNMSSFAATIGTLSAFNSSGSVVLSNGTVTFDSGGAATPIVDVTNSSATAFMYANVLGTSGIRKTGPGEFSFRFNTVDQTYSGGIFLDGGKFTINQNGSLGDSNNTITVQSSSTLQSSPGSNTGTVTISSGHTINLGWEGSAANLTLQNANSNVTTVVQSDIGGTGNLIFGGTGGLVLSGVNGAATVTVNGPGFGGATNTNTIVTRTSRASFASADSLGSSTGLTVALGSSAAVNSSSTINVDLGGFARTPSSLVLSNATNTSSTNSLMAIDITNGSLTYADAASSFNFSARGAIAVTNELRLPETTSLTYSNFSVGVNGALSNAMLNTRVLVGSNATFNANQFTMAAYRASGSIEARAAGATLKLRASDGTGTVPQILIGNFSGGPNPTASINLSNGSVDIAATEIIVGKNIANNSSATGSLLFGNGTVTASSLVVGNGAHVGNTNVSITNTNIVVGTVTQNGGTATISNVVLGRSAAQGTTNGPIFDKYTCTYTMNGGTLAVASIASDSTNAAISGMSRTFNLNGGTLRGFDASSDLNVTATTAANAAIGFSVGTTNSKTIAVDAGRNINFAAGVEFQANGGTTTFSLSSNSVATLAGRFRIGVTGTTDAAVVVTNGTVNLASGSGILGIGDRTSGASALNISGGSVNIGLTTNRMLVGNKFNGSLNVSGGSLTITGNQPLYVGGDTQYGTNGAQGTLTVSGGTVNVGGNAAFVLGLNSTNTNGVITTNVAGTLNLNGGTFTTARAITAGTSGTSSGTVNFNGGTLVAGTNIANMIAVTTATVASNSTIDTGAFDSGIGQNLAGSATITIAGTGTMRLNGSNSPTIVVNSGATLGGTGSAATATVNGTLAPGPAATNGTFTVNSALSVPGTARFRLFGNGINDKVAAPGGANLAGGMVIVTIDTNYTPASGDSFDVIDGTISGSPVLSLPALGGSLTWVTNDFAGSGLLGITNATVPASAYSSWLTNYPTLANTNGSADPDGDGFVNNVEYAFDGNPTIGTPALLTVTAVGTNAVFNWLQRTNGVVYTVQKTTNLTTGPWTGPAAVTISNSANTNGVLLAPTYERKEFVVPAVDKDFYRVQATITNN